MTKNVGNTDKLIRMIIAVVLILWVYFQENLAAKEYVLLLIALLAAATSLMNYCPLYEIFKINTNKKG